MKIEKPYDATRVVALRRMVIDLDTLDYIICQFDFRKLKMLLILYSLYESKMQVIVKYLALFLFVARFLFIL